MCDSWEDAETEAEYEVQLSNFCSNICQTLWISCSTTTVELIITLWTVYYGGNAKPRVYQSPDYGLCYFRSCVTLDYAIMRSVSSFINASELPVMNARQTQIMQTWTTRSQTARKKGSAHLVTIPSLCVLAIAPKMSAQVTGFKKATSRKPAIRSTTGTKLDH